jgi:hypothetical protein
MTTATAATIRVPVRTWQEKAILAYVLAYPLYDLYETRSHDIRLGEVEQHLEDEGASQRLLNGYHDQVEPIKVIESYLSSLEALVPGPDAVLELSSRVPVLQGLDDAIESLVSEPRADGVRRKLRGKLERAIVASDLRDELAEAGA